MSNRNRNFNRNRNNNGQSRAQQEQEYLNKMVHKFVDVDWKTYKKKHKSELKNNELSKKDVEKMYYSDGLDLLPDVADWVFQYGYRRDETTVDIMNRIVLKVVDPKFVKYLYKYLATGNKFENEKDMPMFMNTIIAEAVKLNKEYASGTQDGEEINIKKLEEINMHFMHKNLERFEKAGIPTEVAYNALCVIPYPDVVCKDPTRVAQKYVRSADYRVRLFFKSMYSAAKYAEFSFDKLMKLITDDDGELYHPFILYALLEKKEEYAKLTDNQKKLYTAITTWTFNTLNQYGRDDIMAILNRYISRRRSDDAQGKDANRRYDLTMLYEKDYPEIVKSIQFMLLNNKDIQKYL